VDVTIERSDGEKHRAIAARSDGTAVILWMHDYGDALPHDLVHWVVESELELEWGFWGLVAAGAQLEVVQRSGARAPRLIQPVEDPLVAEHERDLLIAEALVAGFSSFDDGRPLMDRLREHLAGLDALSALPPAESIDAISRHLSELGTVWRSLKPGGRLRLQWNADDLPPDPG
jgi:hypothetical protein